MSEGADLRGAVVVTGAASGIGEGIARRAAARGHAVALADVAEGRLSAVAERLAADGASVVAVPTDVADPGALEHLAEVAFASFERVRIVVNNAGIEATGYAWETSPETVERVIGVNLLGAFNGVRAFVPRLIEQGSEASVVNVASIASLLSGPLLQSAYNASKHGVQALTETLQLELAERGAPISAHVVNPGPVATRILHDAAVEGAGAESARAKLDRLVSEEGMSGEEVGEIVLDGVARGEFWICTHPDWQDDAARQRAAMLIDRTPPKLSTGGRAGL